MPAHAILYSRSQEATPPGPLRVGVSTASGRVPYAIQRGERSSLVVRPVQRSLLLRKYETTGRWAGMFQPAILVQSITRGPAIYDSRTR